MSSEKNVLSFIVNVGYVYNDSYTPFLVILFMEFPKPFSVLYFGSSFFSSIHIPKKKFFSSQKKPKEKKKLPRRKCIITAPSFLHIIVLCGYTFTFTVQENI